MLKVWYSVKRLSGEYLPNLENVEFCVNLL